MELKYCKHCKQLLKRKYRPNGRLEKIRDFDMRKFCDAICAKEFKCKKEVKVVVVETVYHEIECPDHLVELYLKRQWKGASWLQT